MKKELFQPYKEMIQRCISSCILPDQLEVCKDMMDRFNQQFYHIVEPHERADAISDLSNEWLQKSAELSV